MSKNRFHEIGVVGRKTGIRIGSVAKDADGLENLQDFFAESNNVNDDNDNNSSNGDGNDGGGGFSDHGFDTSTMDIVSSEQVSPSRYTHAQQKTSSNFGLLSNNDDISGRSRNVDLDVDYDDIPQSKPLPDPSRSKKDRRSSKGLSQSQSNYNERHRLDDEKRHRQPRKRDEEDRRRRLQEQQEEEEEEHRTQQQEDRKKRRREQQRQQQEEYRVQQKQRKEELEHQERERKNQKKKEADERKANEREEREHQRHLELKKHERQQEEENNKRRTSPNKKGYKKKDTGRHQLRRESSHKLLKDYSKDDTDDVQDNDAHVVKQPSTKSKGKQKHIYNEEDYGDQQQQDEDDIRNSPMLEDIPEDEQPSVVDDHVHQSKQPQIKHHSSQIYGGAPRKIWPLNRKNSSRLMSDNDYSDNPIQTNVRRSTRPKIAPLASWNLERVDFYGRVQNGTETYSKKQRQSRSPSPNSQKRRKYKRKPKSDKTHDFSKYERNTKQEGTVYNADEGRDVIQDIVYTSRQSEPQFEHDPRDPKKMVPMAFKKIFQEPEFFASGMLSIGVKEEKPEKYSGDNTYVFFIIEGVANVIIQDNEFTLATGGCFHIPRYNRYCVQNVGPIVLRLFFTQVRKPSEEEDDHDEEYDEKSFSHLNKRQKTNVNEDVDDYGSQPSNVPSDEE